jgi:cytochrome oxidase Cu insertion factor (SCO1/SenC/PrrC family)
MIKRLVTAICGLGLLLGFSGHGTVIAQEEPVIAKTTLKAGDVAPDFTLLANNWKQVKLSDYRGKKNVILAFYVLAFTGG